MNGPEPAPRRRVIDDDIVELLRERGPLSAADIRTSLGVASESRFECAVLFLMEEGVIERVSVERDRAYRITGDTRPVPEKMTRVIERTTYPRRRART